MTLEDAMERWRSLLDEQGACSQPFRCSVCGDASLPPCPYAKDCDERLDGEAFNAVAQFINRIANRKKRHEAHPCNRHRT